MKTENYRINQTSGSLLYNLTRTGLAGYRRFPELWCMSYNNRKAIKGARGLFAGGIKSNILNIAMDFLGN
jgi:hypothetical protein